MSYVRMEEEMIAQRVTLDEQRLHIDVLDNALSNAQANVVKLQEEVRINWKLFCFSASSLLQKSSIVSWVVGLPEVSNQFVLD